MREIGGYFELELNKGEHYHQDCLKLNSGRSCLNYLLCSKNIKKIYLPYYICESVVRTIVKHDIKIEYYHINESFEPIFNKSLDECEFILYVNYFGICDLVVSKIINKYKNVICDNTQAFFSLPLPNVDTFYSARKFFGVSDGGYLYTDKIIEHDLEKDQSYYRMQHLLKRRDQSASEAYHLFKDNELQISESGLKLMSHLTSDIMSSVNYDKAKTRRKNNFFKIDEKFGGINVLNFSDRVDFIPMTYPLLILKTGIKESLIENGVFIPTYWPEVKDKVSQDSFEWLLCEYLISLPIDQRYDSEEMEYMIRKVEEALLSEKI
jgi:hypothetical protein